MLPLSGDKGRGAAWDSPGPEEVRDTPSSLEGTRFALSVASRDRVRLFAIIG